MRNVAASPRDGAQHEIDRSIIELLKRDGRTSYTDLGRAVGLSGPAVRERLNKLRASGSLDIVGNVSFAALGHRTFGLLGIRVDAPVLDVARDLATVPSIDLVICVSGRYDIFAQVVARDDRDLLRVIDKDVRHRSHVRVEEVFTHLGSEEYDGGRTYRRNWPEPPAALPVLDDADLAILRSLQVDGRATFRDLSAQSGLGYDSTRRRVSGLLDSGIVEIVVVERQELDPDAVQAYVGLAVDGSVSKVRDALRSLPEVRVTTALTGSYDLLVEVVCSDRARYAELLGETLRSIPGVARSTTFEWLNAVKFPHTWSGLERVPTADAPER